MQQRAAVPSISRFEPISEKYAQFLRSRLPSLKLSATNALLIQEAKRLFRQALETSSESSPSPAMLHQLSAMATLEAVRQGKKQPEEAALRGIEIATETPNKEEKRQSLPRLQTALAPLLDNHRRVLALHLLGLSELEIATLLGVKEAKVRHQIERGWRGLRAKLSEGDSKTTTDDDELKSIYQSQPSRRELNRADCLADEFLIRTCTDKASKEERVFVAEHLATCRDCAEEYQLVHALQLWANETIPSHEIAGSQPLISDTSESQGEVTEPASTEPPILASHTEESLAPVAAEVTPRWWQALIPRFVHVTGFNLFTAALTGLFFITSLSLATWLVALHFKHKTQLAQLQQQLTAPPPAVSAEPVTPEILQARIDEAQKQLTDIQTRITEQNADKVLSNQELLGIQNDTLLKELEDLSKPQLDAPVVDIDLTALRAAAPGKEIVTTIDVPNTSAVFTVILHKPADKNAANYLLELFDAKKTKPLWSTQKKLDAQTKIAVILAKRNYPAGKYRFTLSGIEGKKKDLLETYPIEVKYQPPPKQKKKK